MGWFGDVFAPRFPPVAAPAPVWRTETRTPAPRMMLTCVCGAEAEVTAASLAGVQTLAGLFLASHAACRGVG